MRLSTPGKRYWHTGHHVFSRVCYIRRLLRAAFILQKNLINSSVLILVKDDISGKWDYGGTEHLVEMIDKGQAIIVPKDKKRKHTKQNCCNPIFKQSIAVETPQTSDGICPTACTADVQDIDAHVKADLRDEISSTKVITKIEQNHTHNICAYLNSSENWESEILPDKPDPTSEAAVIMYAGHKADRENDPEMTDSDSHDLSSEARKLDEPTAMSFGEEDDDLGNLSPFPFQCCLCDKIYASKSTLRVHMKSHNAKDETDQSECSQNSEMLSIEEEKPLVILASPDISRSTTEKDDNVCQICGVTFSRKYNLQRHMRKHNDTMYPCDLCGHQSYSKTAMQTHISTIHEGRLYHCSFEGCSKTYKSMHGLKMHETVHTNTQRYVCPYCEKRMSYKSEYDAHLSHHTGIKKYSCKRCGGTFTCSSSLQAHLRTCGSDVRPHLCPLCGKSFKVQKYLREHLFLHTEPERYDCKQCGRRLGGRGALYMHMRTKHNMKKARSKQLKDTS